VHPAAAATVITTFSGAATESNKGHLALSGSVQGEPEYDHDEFQISKTEWMLSISIKEGNCSITDTKNHRSVWQNAASVECDLTSGSSGEVIFTGKATIRYTFEAKSGVTARPPYPIKISGNEKEVTVVFSEDHSYYKIYDLPSRFNYEHNPTTLRVITKSCV
jgi:hypothetical protein